VQPAPAPRFSRTAGCLGLPPPHPGQHTTEILEELGMTAAAIASLRQAAAIA
jgi:alpha-methylacyl-CoA racemase